MKKLVLLLLISVGLNAQFNYQAIVKDSNGNTITNNQVKFKFSLMYQSSTATPVYIEEHTVTTPPDGVVNISVGGGTVVNGTFSNIDWSQSVFMKEELDTGIGYQDMGTKQFVSVPYSEYSLGVRGLNLNGENVAVGNYAMQNKDFTTSAGNIAIGEYALQTRTTEISNGSVNVAIGYNALKDNRSGDDNVAINKGALEKNNDGHNNIAIGTNAINKNINGGYNIAVGQFSLESSIAASQSIAIGYQALQYFNNGGEVVNSANTAVGVYALRGESSTSSNTGKENTALGHTSLNKNTGGSYNTAIGINTLSSNRIGSSNTSVGENSMYYNVIGKENTAIGGVSLYSNVEGNANIAVGQGALYYNTNGSGNSALGYNSLNNNEENNNTAVGTYAGTSLISGTLNTAIGYRSDILNNLKNATAIGADATVTASNTIQLGNTDVTLVNTSGVVSATGFKGNADEVTLSYSGTVTNVLAVISDLQLQIAELKEIVNSLSSSLNTSAMTLIAHESFDYAAGTPLYGYDGGFGWNGPWDNKDANQSWFSDRNKHYVINSNSSYGGVYTSNRRSDMTYEGIESVGNYLGNDDQQTDIACFSFRVLQNSISSGVHYVQFIVQFNDFSDSDAAGAANNYFILKNGEDEKLVVRRKDGNIFLTKSITSSLEADIVDTGVSLKGSSEAQLVVFQINHIDSITKIWVDPILSDFNYISPPTADAYLDYIFDFNTILLVSQTKWDFGVPTLFDEIKVMRIE